jgi:hypothetical protein
MGRAGFFSPQKVWEDFVFLVWIWLIKFLFFLKT